MKERRRRRKKKKKKREETQNRPKWKKKEEEKKKKKKEPNSQEERKKRRSQKWSKVAAGTVCGSPFMCLITILSLTDGNRVIEIELSFAKQPFCHGPTIFKLWVMETENWVMETGKPNTP